VSEKARGSTVPVAVVGVGALGQHHARVLAELSGARLVGVYDRDRERAKEVGERHSCPALPSLEAVAEEARAVVVATPTVDHHDVARRLLEAGRDVLVEKPMTSTLDEADALVRAAASREAILQVGHVERFNPAAQVLKDKGLKPRFIEVHRLASFVARSLDIDVVLDLMIHDLDLLLLLDPSEVVQVDAVGVPILTGRVDIGNVRLRFQSGLIANLTASRVSTEKVRKFRVFAPRTYISADFQAREAQVYRLVEADGRPTITIDRVASEGPEPLVRQLESFLACVRERTPPEVGGEEARKVLALAHRVLGAMGDVPAEEGGWVS
jgi:predicted dehydrogenase